MIIAQHNKAQLRQYQSSTLYELQYSVHVVHVATCCVTVPVACLLLTPDETIYYNNTDTHLGICLAHTLGVKAIGGEHRPRPDTNTTSLVVGKIA